MELTELKTIWQAQNVKLEKSLKLNLHCLEMIQAQRVRSQLAPLLWQRLIEVLFYIVVIGWLASFLYDHVSQWPYVLSALALISVYTIAFINCVKQIITVKRIDYTEDVISLQSSLEILQTHVVNYLRLTFLVIPIYLAYPIVGFKALGFDILINLQGDWWKAQILFCVLILPICIWLYREMTYKNMHKKWVKLVIGMSGERVLRSMEFLKELDKLKMDKYV